MDALFESLVNTGWGAIIIGIFIIIALIIHFLDDNHNPKI